MSSSARVAVRTPHVRVRWFMAIAWAIVVVKCILVMWAVSRWHMPFHANWVVLPTLVFALLATALWLTHRER